MKINTDKISQTSNNNLQIKSLSLGQLETNCYLLYCKKTLECLIVDPADSGELITQSILDLQLTPLGIFFTHGHFDHVLASLELKLNFNIQIFMHQKDTNLLKNAQKSAQYWLQRTVDPVPQSTAPISENSKIQIGQSFVTVYETPGHTPGSIVLFANEPQPFLCTGDTLFKAGVGRTDFEYSSPKDLRQSLNKIFTNFPPETIIYPGHGQSSTLKEEIIIYQT